ncbi:hypothetical protein FJY63_02640, partial [Candidatus Sumerlaeota bacterium]|nr:hypothetical protein [Candidatus Sumerlaeota bacterium]
RVIRFLVLFQPEVLEHDTLTNALWELVSGEDMFWKHFFFDLFLRQACGYTMCGEHLAKMAEHARDDYLVQWPDKPLSRLWPLISDPLARYKQLSLDDYLQILGRIAGDCRDGIECKWCLLALLRVLPLYDPAEDAPDYSDPVLRLIAAFDRNVVAKSPQIQFSKLRRRLSGFNRTMNPELLIEFERDFIRSRNKLARAQIVHLQLEYASCLHRCRTFLPKEATDRTMFGLLFSARNPLTHQLFSNHLTGPDCAIRLPEDPCSKNAQCSWLIKYTQRLYHLQASSLIEQNHLRALQFEAATRVYENRPLFSNAILRSVDSLGRFEEAGLRLPASFYARSTAVFDLVPRHENLSILRKYAENALGADLYWVMRNSNSIAQCIYWCFYYDRPGRSATDDQLADRLAEVTNIAAEGEVPKLHWAYYAGVKYTTRAIEKEFLDALWNAPVLVPIEHDPTGVSFPDSVLDCVRCYSQGGSLYAKVLRESLSNPEAWNTIATTLYNNRSDAAALSLHKAARFYSFARCLARGSKRYDQKYWYNYIRCKAAAHTLSGDPPPQSYFEEVADYLVRPEASLFALKFRKECTQPYLVLYREWHSRISEDAQRGISRKLNSVTWLRGL